MTDVPETQPDIAHFRKNGITHLWVNCTGPACNYEAIMSLEGLPDDLVLADLKPRIRCAKCGREGIDVTPDWRILHIAEIPYKDGTTRFRYARKLSPDGTRWIRDGRFCSYHPNGTLASEGMYVDDQEHGLWTDYHTNGQVAAKGHYANGKEVGQWEFWSSDGSPEESE